MAKTTSRALPSTSIAIGTSSATRSSIAAPPLRRSARAGTRATPTGTRPDAAASWPGGR